MANQLTMAEINAILTLHESEHSNREIARELGIDRGTVARYVRLAAEAARAEGSAREPEAGSAGSKPANAPIGSSPKPANAPIGSLARSEDSGLAMTPVTSEGSGPRRAIPARLPGRQSDCEPWREVIRAKSEQGLSAKRIHQDLVGDLGARVSYDSVRRFLRRLGRTRPLPFRRMECEPGEEAQTICSVSGQALTYYLTETICSVSGQALTYYIRAAKHQGRDRAGRWEWGGENRNLM